jgi:hypothetical protein
LPRTCTICEHDLGHQINVDLVQPQRNYRRIAAQYDISDTALRRHAHDHLPKLLVESSRAVEVARADDLLGNIEAMTGRLEAFIDSAEAARDGEEFRANVAEWRKLIELLARIAGQLQEAGQINIYLNPQWVQLEQTIVQALAPYPDARRAVVGAIKEVEGNGRS